MSFRWDKTTTWITRFDLGWGEFRSGYPDGDGYSWRLVPLYDDATKLEHVTHAWQAKRAIARAAEERKWTPRK